MSLIVDLRKISVQINQGDPIDPGKVSQVTMVFKKLKRFPFQGIPFQNQNGPDSPAPVLIQKGPQVFPEEVRIFNIIVCEIDQDNRGKEAHPFFPVFFEQIT